MASIPEHVLQSKPIGDTTSEQRGAVRRLSDDELINHYLNPGKCPYDKELIKFEHEFRLFNLSYASKFQKADLKNIEKMQLGETRYDVFKIDPFLSVPLPASNFLFKWIYRMQGRQCSKVIDTNNNHKPDNGDTCIGRNGAEFPNAKFIGKEIWATKIGTTCNYSQFKYFDKQCVAPTPGTATFYNENSNTTFDVHHPGPLERFSMSLASEMQEYGHRIYSQAKAVLKSIGVSAENNPILYGAALLALFGLAAHPATRAVTLKGLNVVGGAGAIGGTGYLAYNRVDGIVTLAKTGDIKKFKQEVGKHDFVALTSILGGMSVFKGISVKNAAKTLFNAPLKAAGKMKSVGQSFVGAIDDVAGGMGGGPSLVCVGAGYGGTGGALVGEVGGALSAAGTLTGGSVWSGLGGLFPSIFAMSRFGGKVTYDGTGYSLKGAGKGKDILNNPKKAHKARLTKNSTENNQVKDVLQRIKKKLGITGNKLKKIKKRIHWALGKDKMYGKTKLKVEIAAAEKDISYARVESAGYDALDFFGIDGTF